jgi:hypothetical protein
VARSGPATVPTESFRPMPIDRVTAIRIAQEIVQGAALETVAARTGNPDELVVATELARELVSAANRPQPIASAPPADHRELLLFCPQQGGWYTGEWLGGKWVLAMDLEHELRPTHWLIAPAWPGKLD